MKKTDLFDKNFFKRLFVNLTCFQLKIFNEEANEAMRQVLIEGNRKQDWDILQCPEPINNAEPIGTEVRKIADSLT